MVGEIRYRSIDPQVIDRVFEKAETAQPDIQPLLSRVGKYLSADDRIFMELSASRKWSQRQIAEMVRMSPGSVARRFRRILQQLTNPLILALMSPACTLGPQDRQLALEYFLGRKKIQDLIKMHNLPRQRITGRLEFVRGWGRGLLLAESLRALPSPRRKSA